MMHFKVRPLNRFANAEGGQALIEFCLFCSLFVIILIGVSDLSFYLIAAMAVQEAATEGAAYGASPGNQNDNNGMVSSASQAAFGAALTSAPVAKTFYTCSPNGAQYTSPPTCSGSSGPMEYVKVTATATVNPLFNAAFLGGTMKSTATYRVAWKTQ
jgi:Flp pilus assembly protein TadG